MLSRLCRPNLTLLCENGVIHIHMLPFIQTREETAQSPQVLAPDERQIVKIARMDQNGRSVPESSAQTDSRSGYSERQPCKYTSTVL